jgi:uncharacterized damage-inducible protein DinB
MYHTISEFLQDWKVESELTLKIFCSLTDKSLNQAIPDYRRTIGRLAWHIAGSIGKMMRMAGSPIKAVEETEGIPLSAAKIQADYQTASANMSNKINNDWSDASLKDEVNMFGRNMTRADILKMIITHQIHHRAQLTVLMRQAGLKVSGIYGPSYEEWEKVGMKPRE